MGDYYVYVYIDPRNHEEFYYGKGKGSRKGVHEADQSESDKARRIADIKEEGLRPIIRVIARDLAESEAFLIEKTLLWKLGKTLANVATGHFAEHFRPHNTLHKDLPGFDFRNGFFYYNVGEGPHRNWDDYVRFSFISAGQGQQWRDQIRGFRPGDLFAAYLKRRGFVGIGRIQKGAERIRDVRIGETPLLSMPLTCKRMADNSENEALSEYVCSVEWLKTFARNESKWRMNPKLYTTPLIRASLEGQPNTVRFLEEQFEVDIEQLIK